MKTGWWKVHFDVTLDGVDIDFLILLSLKLIIVLVWQEVRLYIKKDAAFVEKAASIGGVASSLPKWRQR